MSILITHMPFLSHHLAIACHHTSSPKLICIDWLPTSLSSSDIPSYLLTNIHQPTQYWQKTLSHHGVKPTAITYTLPDQLNPHLPQHQLLQKTIHQLSLYQDGKLTQFDLPLDLSIGTEFQQTVWKALQTIKYGHTISYAELAALIHRPTAYRAVANANGKNPFSIIIPCHRVIASDGGLGGYTGGIDKKQCLLNIENKHINHKQG